MIDFILGAIVGSAVVFAIFHFKGETPQKVLSDITSLEQRIKLAMSQAFKDAFAAYQSAVEADKAAAVAKAIADAQATQADALAAAQAQGAQAESDEDTATVQAAHDALAGAA